MAVLPVELIRFDGRLAGKTNVIEWETASEINVFEHVLERSPNGIDGYEVIARQPGSAFSSELLNYQYIDRNPWPLGYYRLTTYDFDGKTERHKVISLKRNDNHLVIYEPNPNPFSDRITIPNFSIEPTFIQYNLVNQIGQTVQSGQLELPQGYNHYELPIDAAPAGVYYLNLFTDLDSYLFQVVRER
ncbi:MAG: T9SS type A sorting domain-containing protein [Saprospiraceae bacterium]